MNFPSDAHPLLLSTDASKTGIGGILYQEIDNEKKILYYHSEVLTASQKRFHPIELEALAIFKCMNRMRSLILGRSITVYTDNCPDFQYDGEENDEKTSRKDLAADSRI